MVAMNTDGIERKPNEGVALSNSIEEIHKHPSKPKSKKFIKIFLGVVAGLIVLVAIYVGLVVSANNKFNALLNDWDSRRSDDTNTQLNIMAEIDAVSDKLATVSTAETTDINLVNQGSTDARAADQHYQQSVKDSSDLQKNDAEKFKTFSSGFWSYLLTSKQKDILTVLPAAQADELPTDQVNKENTAYAGYMINYFDLINGMEAFVKSEQAKDANAALLEIGALKKFADSDQLYADSSIKEILPSTYNTYKSGLEGLGLYYKSIALAANPNITQAEYTQSIGFYNQAKAKIQVFIGGQEDSNKEIIVLASKTYGKTDKRIYESLNSYSNQKEYRFFATVKPSLNVDLELAQAIYNGTYEYLSSTANSTPNPGTVDELVATLKTKGIVTWLPDKISGVKLIKHDKNAYLQFPVKGQQREIRLFEVNTEAPTNQST